MSKGMREQEKARKQTLAWRLQKEAALLTP